MDREKALALLDLDASASEKQIRSQLFSRYQSINETLAQLDDERQRPLLEAQLNRLNQARDVLLAQASDTSTTPHLSVVRPQGSGQLRVILYQYQGQQEIETILAQQFLRINQADVVLLTEQEAASPEQDVITEAQPADIPPSILVLLYNRGGQEGLHTIRMGERDFVLGFENTFGARKFAQRLAQQGQPKPRSERFETSEILDFCHASGYVLIIVPSSSTFNPPETVTEIAREWEDD